MEITDFPYIILAPRTEKLHDAIASFYIANHQMKTLEHVTAVAQMNIRIAERFILEKEKCCLAALLHDVGSVMKPNDMTPYAIAHGIVLDESEKRYPFLLHQQISRLFAESVFGITDMDVLSAISCHTTLKPDPSKYDMALFVADKLSWNQGGQPSFFEDVHAALSTSLEAAALQYMNAVVANHQVLSPHKWFADAHTYLKAACAPKCEGQ